MMRIVEYVDLHVQLKSLSYCAMRRRRSKAMLLMEKTAGSESQPETMRFRVMQS